MKTAANLMILLFLCLSMTVFLACKPAAGKADLQSESSENEAEFEEANEDGVEPEKQQSPRQIYNSNQQAIAAEIQTYATMAIQWWRVPIAQGGAGQEFPSAAGDELAKWMGFGTDMKSVYQTENGKYMVFSANSPDRVELRGIGKEWRKEGYPLVKTLVNLRSGGVQNQPGKDEDGEF